MPESPQEKLRLPPQPPEEERFSPAPLEYAELDVTTNFSFLRGASHPDELVLQAVRLGLRAIAATDLNTLAGGDDQMRVRNLLSLSRRFDVPVLATNAVHYHEPFRRPLQDILTCIRHQCTIREAGFRLFPNGERYLKSPEQMHRLFAGIPQALRRGINIADRCNFSLDELRYEYPDEIVPPG